MTVLFNRRTINLVTKFSRLTNLSLVGTHVLFQKKELVMNIRQRRTVPVARLMLLYITDTPEDEEQFNMKERMFLGLVKKHPYSALGIVCHSEEEAVGLFRRFIIRGPIMGTPSRIASFQFVVNFPTIVDIEILQIYVGSDLQLCVAREHIDPKTPHIEALIKNRKYYLFFDLQCFAYQDLLMRISNT